MVDEQKILQFSESGKPPEPETDWSQVMLNVGMIVTLLAGAAYSLAGLVRIGNAIREGNKDKQNINAPADSGSRR